MAAGDLNLNLNYFDHPKTVRLVGILGRDSDVLPIRLWCHCGRHHFEDGRLAGYTADEIEAIIGWRGERGKCVAALCKLGFLEQVDGGYAVHDFLDHNGHIAMLKRRNRENGAKGGRPPKPSGYATGEPKSPNWETPSLPTNQPSSPQTPQAGSAPPAEEGGEFMKKVKNHKRKGFVA
jgi:hypothetical protein